MGLLQRPTSGKVFFRDEEATPEKSLLMRRRMASVFQEPLLLNATVYDNAALGLKLRGLPRDQIEKQLRPWLERLGIMHLTSRQVRTLSGGEAQRTSLARALALDPDLLLLDEPFSALDAPTRETLLLDLQEILTETAITTILVTHDLHEATVLGNRIGILRHGELLQLASHQEVFAHPASEKIAAIVGMDNRIPGVVEAVTNGMTKVRIDRAVATVMGRFEPGAQVILCIRPEDLRLGRCRGSENDSTRTNCLEAKVGRISPWMAQYRIALKSSEHRLVALISKASFDELRLQAGDEVVASFALEAVHVIGPRGV
jgi:tungstate transport system ATP-binding protein